MWAYELLMRSLSQEDPLEKGMANHSTILVWRIPWTEEPGGLQFIGSQRVGHDRATNNFTFQNAFLCHLLSFFIQDALI